MNNEIEELNKRRKRKKERLPKDIGHSNKRKSPKKKNSNCEKDEADST